MRCRPSRPAGRSRRIAGPSRSSCSETAATPRPAGRSSTSPPSAAHSAREGFAANLFAAGGIATVSGPPEEFAASGTTIACLCSSDKVYAEQAEPAAAALRAAGATQVYLAGKGSHAGVDEYLYVGVDALALLTSVLTQLGVQ